ncbi:hypothetical protein QQ045_010105 [Rhodiola kirilowii]
MTRSKASLMEQETRTPSQVGETHLHRHKKRSAKEERNRILDLGPWSFDNQPLVLCHWSPDMNYSLESVVSLPLWVTFPELPPHMQREDMLSKLASSIGRPLRTDGFTAQKEKLMYARVLVEVFASNEFKKSVVIKDPRGVHCKIPGFRMEDVEDVNDQIIIEPDREENIVDEEAIQHK